MDVVGSLGEDEGATSRPFGSFEWSGGDESGGMRDESGNGEGALHRVMWRNRMKSGFESALNDD